MDPGRNHSIWPIDKLSPYARNARKHSDEQVAQVVRSIEQWGFTTPILVDTGGEIIAGHCRLMAAQKMGLSEVPVIIADGWSDAQKKAYVIADNQLTLNGSWDYDLLWDEVNELVSLDFDIELMGIDPRDLPDLDVLKDTGGTKEISTDIDTEHKCPRCGFDF